MAEISHVKGHVVVCGLIRFQDKWLLAKRASRQAMPLKWEFPGGKVEPLESLEEAIVREIDEELGISVVPLAHGPFVDFKVKETPYRLCPFYLSLKSTTAPIPREHAQLGWFRLKEIHSLDLADPDRPILSWLKKLDVKLSSKQNLPSKS